MALTTAARSSVWAETTRFGPTSVTQGPGGTSRALSQCQTMHLQAPGWHPGLGHTPLRSGTWRHAGQG